MKNPEKVDNLEILAQMMLDAYWDDKTFQVHTRIIEMNRGTEKEPWMRMARTVENLLSHARKEVLRERDRFKLALETIESWDSEKETVEGVISRLKFIARQVLAEVKNGHHNLTSELVKGTP